MSGNIALIALATLISVATPALAQSTPAAAKPAATATGEFPDAWYYYPPDKPAMVRLRSMAGRKPPPLTVKDWVNGERRLEDLVGRVVVVEFWGLWCPPCRAAMPKNRQMVMDYVGRDFAFIGVHSTKSGERLADSVVPMQINYPVAVDVDNTSARAWNVGFWPTYVIIDKTGKVRTAGLRPERVRQVVEKLIAEGDTGGGSAVKKTTQGEIPRIWLEGPRKRARLADLEAADTPPPVVSETWLNSDPLDLESLRGRVVLLDFWATWCRPCISSIPKMNQMHRKYGPEGLVIIGVCHPRGVEKMPEVAERFGIQYALCADTDGAMKDAYRVDGFPDYYFIDRSGRLRVADASNGVIEQVVKQLLAEEAE